MRTSGHGRPSIEEHGSRVLALPDIPSLPILRTASRPTVETDQLVVMRANTHDTPNADPMYCTINPRSLII